MRRLSEELSQYDSSLSQKTQVVAINKLDLRGVRSRRGEIEGEMAASGKRTFFISAASGEGLLELLSEVTRVLRTVSLEKPTGEETTEKVFQPQPSQSAQASYVKEGNTFVISCQELERTVAGPGGREAEVVEFYRRRLSRNGISRSLKRSGAKPGDKIRLGNIVWEWP